MCSVAKSPLLVLTSVFVIFLLPQNEVYCLESSNLELFVLFDNVTGLNNIAKGSPGVPPDQIEAAKLVTFVRGPFNESATSYSVHTDNRWIGNYNIGKFPSSFTVAFYVYLSEQRFGLDFVSSSTARLFSLSTTSNSALTIYPTDCATSRSFSIVTWGAWNFFAVAYSATSKMFTVYGPTGKALGSWSGISLASGHSVNLRVGRFAYYTSTSCSSSYYYDYGMYTNDAISCLTMFHDVLSPEDIAQLPELCRSKGSSINNPTQGAIPWPKPSSLVGLWPLAGVSNLKPYVDLGPNAAYASGLSVEKSQLTIGPFGDDLTALQNENGTKQILVVSNSKIAIQSSLTVAFFVSVNSKENGGLFQFGDVSASNALQIGYENGTTLHVRANGVTIGRYMMVQQQGAWTFAAFTFDGMTGMFSVYSRHGLFQAPTMQPLIWASNGFNRNGLIAGAASYWATPSTSTIAMSCIMVWAEVLDANDIKQAIDGCRTVHGSPPSGSPRLPLVPIPKTGTAPYIPSPGQFPFLASIRLNSKGICSGTILSEFWVLTTASCFSTDHDFSYYRVVVGDQDTMAIESHERQHTIGKVFKAQDDNTKRNLALIQLTTPIDFTNPYVSDARLFDDDVTADDYEFVPGWGSNGRSPLISQGLIRYVNGLRVPGETCQLSWTSSFVPDRDTCFTTSTVDKSIPCTGDEGSPLLLQGLTNEATALGERLVQYAVYYGRDANCTALKPALFAKLSNYESWIKKTIACSVPGVSDPQNCPLL